MRPGLRAWIEAVGTRRGVAAALVTVLTFVVIGVVLMATTPLGCGPAKAVGFKTIAACNSRPVASHSPTPSPSPLLSPSPAFSPQPPTSPESSPSAPPFVVPPGPIPATGPATNSYPPFYPGATGSNGSVSPALSLNCRLPVYVGPPGSGGFIVFPGGTFIGDPASAVSLPTPPVGEPTPNPTSGGYYGPGSAFSYDAAFKKWLPVPYSWVTPDGSRYAFTSPLSIYVEDVASGTLSQVGAGQAWTIVGVQAAGVYAEPQGKAGLWLLPFSGSARQITSSGFWQAVSGTAAFGTATSAVPQGATNEILRLDLSSGQTTSWFSRQDSQSSVTGVDGSGAPVINVNYSSNGYYYTEVWVVPAPGKGIPLGGNGGYQIGPALNGTPIPDSHGLWFSASAPGGPSGFALYVPNTGIYMMSGLAAQLGGPCVEP